MIIVPTWSGFGSRTTLGWAVGAPLQVCELELDGVIKRIKSSLQMHIYPVYKSIYSKILLRTNTTNLYLIMPGFSFF